MAGLYSDLPQRVKVLGVPIDPWSMAQTVEACDRIVREGCFAHLMGVNADKLLQMRDDPWMDACVRRCEVVNADGASMVMAAERLGVDVPERVAGVDLMWELCALAEKAGYPIYLLGAKSEIVAKAVDVLREKYPKLNVCGLRDGYFKEDELDSVYDEVSALRPAIVFVGITSPKKEQLIEGFRELGVSGAYVGVGGAFDVVSGNIPRAPVWMQKARLEWLFRMFQEPRRLVKRYVVGNARFFRILRAEEKRARRGL
ncbi:WecB/TagA/CpsF family glycosyltransferase [Adlercreutzia sp. ZJ141]|uniref:WecB/TagA/CpsF family glycosyltransferase n=1 Tax=Adlercreutzia sp. ZJ141 TaxID=2709406 RepID=UPI0013ECA4C3|nr:WecB/TagA/CpsF family glycosyltransferase [Adlercreutzia sp. ZJ141]